MCPRGTSGRSREQDFHYSFAAYLKPSGKKRKTKKPPAVYCLTNTPCALNQKSVPRAGYLTSNVNKHMKFEHGYAGAISITQSVNIERVHNAVADGRGIVRCTLF